MAKHTVVVTKANFTYEVDESRMPPQSVAYVHEYGWRQVLIDTVASIKRESFASDAEFHAAAKAKSDKRWNQLVAGTPPKTATPIDIEAAFAAKMGMTVDQLRAQLAKPMATAKKVA